LAERDFTESTGSATLEDNDSFEDGSGSGEGEVGGGLEGVVEVHEGGDAGTRGEGEGL
jgi:hypothetical protein